MALTVLSVAFPFAPVSADVAGGAEQVLHALDAALVRAGHRSIVIARKGSTVAGALLPLDLPDGPIDDAARALAHQPCREAIREALARFPVDLVHLHGLDFHAYLPPPGPPVLVTLHLPLEWHPEGALTPARPGTYLHGVSWSQHRTAPPGVHLLPPIENGVPVDRLEARHVKKRGFALCLGRICPEKGYHLALDATRAAGVPLLIAGTLFPYGEHERHFHEDIAPRLDRRHRWLGPVGFLAKRRLLTAARCLLVPSLCPETSSLVVMEALACGTPVVAFPNGALPEIVEPGRTGFLVPDVAAMAEAIHAAAHLDPETCRAVARERFSAARMTARYLERYAQLA